MLMNILIAAFIIVVTVAIHAGAMMLTVRLIRKEVGGFRQQLRQTHLYRVSGIVLLMFLASLIEVWVWAVVYLWLNAIQGIEQAFYFSMVTFTTLGYGDVVLQERWRLLASFQAANGVILFGWTTAIVMAVVHRVYFQKEK
ncbi:MAG: potassium channel family protein [Anaerohalosphaeraceae bacterium]